MPELPETETIARDLDGMLRHAALGETTVHRADVLRETSALALDGALRDRIVTRVWRRAKLIVLDLAISATGTMTGTVDNTVHLVVQPRFTGALLVDDGTLPDSLLDYLVLSIALADGRTLHYRDVRRLGTVALMSAGRFAEYSAKLGPEPLDPAFTSIALQDTFSGTRRPIKAALMDQRRLAGVGNIYATEALWTSRIDPSRATDTLSDSDWRDLHAALQRILLASIAARGTSFRDYRDARGARGAYVDQLSAYGRAGAPCSRCNRRLVGTQAVDGRATVFCAWCQR